MEICKVATLTSQRTEYKVRYEQPFESNDMHHIFAITWPTPNFPKYANKIRIVIRSS